MDMPHEEVWLAGLSHLRVWSDERSLLVRIASPKASMSMVLENMPPALWMNGVNAVSSISMPWVLLTSHKRQQ